jgi:hypothetical protein
MIFLTILFCIAVYIVLAVLFVNFVKNRTDIKFYKWLAVAFVILLPTWDVVLGYLVYYPACMFVPKTAIYETAETGGIYYEGDYKNYIFDLSDGERRVGLDNLDFEKGYKFVESLVTRKEKNISNRDYVKITPVIYRCTPLPRRPETPAYQPVQCDTVSNIQSEYMVKVKKVTMGITEINFMIINKRSTGKLMGEYNEVVRWPAYVPFFNWMKWRWWSGMGTSCPAKRQFYSFQYNVLKSKQ